MLPSRLQSHDGDEDVSSRYCTDSQPLDILNEFKQQYENLVAEVDANASCDEARRNELKLKIMTNWVKDLGEQNNMLVQTVHKLEQATISGVKRLENKMQETSNLLTINISQSSESEGKLVSVSHSILQVESKQDDLEKKIGHLQSDIKNLLQFFKRGVEENNWDTDGFTFHEINISDIPVAKDCTCGKEFLKSQEVLTTEFVDKEDTINILKSKIIKSKKPLQESKRDVQPENETINDLKSNNKASNRKVSANIKRVSFGVESCQNLEDKNVKDELHDKAKKDLEDLKKLNTIIKEKFNQTINSVDENYLDNTSVESQHEFLAWFMDVITSKEILKTFQYFQDVIESLTQTLKQFIMERDYFYNRIKDIKTCLDEYNSNTLEMDHNRKYIKEFITSIENKVIDTQKLFQNECEMYIKENIMLQIKEIIFKVIFGIQTLSKINKNKNATNSSIEILTNSSACNTNMIQEREQKYIFATFLQQYPVMDEFRICTVEVQAVTEDLREELSAIISYLNTQQCQYVEFTEMISQVQDYLRKTRENISEVINHLELQDEESARHSERITNNRIRLKDIKNKFNQTQSTLSKCLNNVQNNLQQTNLLGYAEIHTCNDLLISLVDEVEQIVYNIHNFQSQGHCTLSIMTNLRKQLTVMEHEIKELKKKSNQILLENEAGHKIFTEKSKRLERYECEIDNCHTKMQNVLECIIFARDQINEFGCIKELDDSFQNTNETIKMKKDLRKLHKECEELKLKISQKSGTDKQDANISDWEFRVCDLQDQIKMLETEMKCKQSANTFLKQRIASLEKELDTAHTKVIDYRKSFSTECLELKNKVFELENSLRVQKDNENNFKCLANDGTDSKKSQLFDYISKNCLYDSTLKHGLQNENVPQAIETLQDTILAIKHNLQDVENKLKISVSEGSTETCNLNDSIIAAIEILVKCIESIQYCSSEAGKIKDASYSKTTLMENMDEIIRIQKDTITRSQSEVENLHKTLQEKINDQEKNILQSESDKRHLNKQLELQAQTIGHLQDALVEAKRSIDQLNNKAATDVSEPWTTVSPAAFKYSNVHDV